MSNNIIDKLKEVKELIAKIEQNIHEAHPDAQCSNLREIEDVIMDMAYDVKSARSYVGIPTSYTSMSSVLLNPASNPSIGDCCSKLRKFENKGLRSLSAYDTDTLKPYIENTYDLSYILKECYDLTEFNVPIKSAGYLDGMFYGCRYLKNAVVQPSNKYIYSVDNMFYGCNSLESVTLNNNVIGTNLTNNSLFGLFKDCSSLKEINIPSWDTSRIRDFGCMFYYCSRLENLNIPTIVITDWAHYTNYMFYYFGNQNDPTLITIDGSNWNTENVKDMSYMFYNSYANFTGLENLDLSSAKNIESMFAYSNISDFNFVSGWDVSNITKMNSLFSKIKRQEEMDLSGWTVNKNCSVGSMFSDWNQSEEFGIDKLKMFDISHMTNIDNLMSNANIREIEWFGGNTTPDLTNVVSANYAFNYFPLPVVIEDMNLINLENANSMFGNCKTIDVVNLNQMKKLKKADYMFNYSSATEAVFEGEYPNLEDMNSMFYGCQNLTKVSFKNAKVPKAKKMDSLMGWCSNLELVDLTNAEFDVLESFSDFIGSEKEVEIRTEGFSAPNVTTFGGFHSNTIDKIDYDILNSFPKLKNVSRLYDYCTNLNEVVVMKKIIKPSMSDLSYAFEYSTVTGVDFTDVTINNDISFESCFRDVKTLEGKIDLAAFNNPEAVMNLRCMFRGCDKISQVDLSNFEAKEGSDLAEMFYGCKSLKNGKITGLDKVYNGKYNTEFMFADIEFSNADMLKSVDFTGYTTLKNFFADWRWQRKLDAADFQFASTGITSLENFCRHNENLREADLSSINTADVTTFWDMFGQCYKLKKVNLDGFQVDSKDYVTYMFNGVENLCDIYMRGCSKATIEKVFKDGYFNRDVRQGCYRRLHCDEELVGTLSQLGNWIYAANTPEITIDDFVFANQGSGSFYSNWDISLVNDLSGTFTGSTYSDIDLCGWDVSHVTSFNNMFENCTTPTIELSNWKINGSTDNMFNGALVTRLICVDVDAATINKIFLSSGFPADVEGILEINDSNIVDSIASNLGNWTIKLV